MKKLTGFLVICGLLYSMACAADIAQDLRDHKALSIHPGALSVDAASTIGGVAFATIAGLLGILFNQNQKTGDSVERIHQKLGTIQAEVRENTSFRKDVSEFSRDLRTLRETTQDLKAATRQTIISLNIQREESGKPPLPLPA